MRIRTDSTRLVAASTTFIIVILHLVDGAFNAIRCQRCDIAGRINQSECQQIVGVERALGNDDTHVNKRVDLSNTFSYFV